MSIRLRNIRWQLSALSRARNCNQIFAHVFKEIHVLFSFGHFVRVSTMGIVRHSKQDQTMKQNADMRYAMLLNLCHALWAWGRRNPHNTHNRYDSFSYARGSAHGRRMCRTARHVHIMNVHVLYVNVQTWKHANTHFPCAFAIVSTKRTTQCQKPWVCGVDRDNVLFWHWNGW